MRISQQVVLGTVLSPSQHISELHAIACQVAELADVGQRDKAGLV